MTAPADALEAVSAGASPIGALSRLIKEANDNGVSYGQLAARAIDPETGATLVKQYLQKLAETPPANPPSPERLRAIAAALRKSERRIKEAAAEQWLEYQATELAGYGEEVRIIVGHLAGKTRAEQRRWLAMIEADEQARRED